VGRPNRVPEHVVVDRLDHRAYPRLPFGWPHHFAADREFVLQDLDTMRHMTGHAPRRRALPGWSACGPADMGLGN
jgi:hypothetical protein